MRQVRWGATFECIGSSKHVDERTNGKSNSEELESSHLLLAETKTAGISEPKKLNCPIKHTRGSHLCLLQVRQSRGKFGLSCRIARYFSYRRKRIISCCSLQYRLYFTVKVFFFNYHYHHHHWHVGPWGTLQQHHHWYMGSWGTLHEIIVLSNP